MDETRVDYLLTASTLTLPLFEFTIAPAFNTRAHYHTKIEELFYVLDANSTCVAHHTVRGDPRHLRSSRPRSARVQQFQLEASRMLLVTHRRP